MFAIIIIMVILMVIVKFKAARGASKARTARQVQWERQYNKMYGRK